MVTEISKTTEGYTLKDDQTTVTYLKAEAFRVSLSTASNNRVALVIYNAQFIDGGLYGGNSFRVAPIEKDYYYMSVGNVKVNNVLFAGTQNELITLINTSVFN